MGREIRRANNLGSAETLRELTGEAVRDLPFAFPPTSRHEQGRIAIPKAVWLLSPAREKFLPVSKRPLYRH